MRQPECESQAASTDFREIKSAEKEFYFPKFLLKDTLNISC